MLSACADLRVPRQYGISRNASHIDQGIIQFRHRALRRESDLESAQYLHHVGEAAVVLSSQAGKAKRYTSLDTLTIR